VGEIIEGSKLKRDLKEEADVCIVGSGCGGATLAMRLAEAGWKVVLLERGGYYTAQAGDFDQREEHAFFRIDGGRGFHFSESASVVFLYGNCVGGASVHYWADTYRTPRDRLELWEREYGVEYHTYEELLPHFERIERDLSVTPAPDHLLNPLNRLLESALKDLGWEGHRVPQARTHCIASGYCMQGCAYDAKQSQLVTTIPRALRHNTLLYADTEALTLLKEDKRITGIKARFLDNRRTTLPTGFTLEVRAKIFVLALGGFETAPFLLRNGFGQSLPALGARLYANPSVMVFGLFPDRVNQHRGIPAGVGCMEFRLPRYDQKGEYREGGYMLMPNQLQPGTMAAALPGFGGEHDALMERFPYLGSVIAWIDDEDPGRIELKRGEVRWHYTIGKRDWRKIQDAMIKGALWLFTAGATRVYLGDAKGTILRSPEDLPLIRRLRFNPGEILLACPHPAGSAPMGRDPEHSVVDSHHRVYGTENLYIADPSVFPTAVSVDPSETIMAFSHRLADFLLA